MTGPKATRRRFAVPRWDRRRALRELLLEWLVTLPPGGWAGTIGRLELDLFRVQARTGLAAVIPSGSGLARVVRAEVDTFAALGFRLTTGRTAEVRAIRVSPTG